MAGLVCDFLLSRGTVSSPHPSSGTFEPVTNCEPDTSPVPLCPLWSKELDEEGAQHAQIIGAETFKDKRYAPNGRLPLVCLGDPCDEIIVGSFVLKLYRQSFMTHCS